jgi:hypothetical protein
VAIAHQAPSIPFEKRASRSRQASSGQVLSFPKPIAGDAVFRSGQPSGHPEMAPTWTEETGAGALDAIPTVSRLALYPYQMSHALLEEVIEQLNLPIRLVNRVEQSEAILTLKSSLRKHANLRRLAERYQVPIYAVRTNTATQIATTLQQALGQDDSAIAFQQALDVAPTIASDINLTGFAYSGDEDDEWDALEEARLAVEQVVIPKGQPVELLPRSAYVRKIQHEFVEHYRLKSSSFGTEPNRRLRIYPA